MKLKLIYVIATLLLITRIASAQTVDGNIATLADAPAIQFDTSGWSYSNTTNPFLLTPDYMTNAMLGISRFKPKDFLLNGGPPIPASLDFEIISELLRKRLSQKEDLEIFNKIIGENQVVVAMYSSENQKGIEYAFHVDNRLIHILLLAKKGSYYKQGKIVAEKLVSSLKLYVP